MSLIDHIHHGDVMQDILRSQRTYRHNLAFLIVASDADGERIRRKANDNGDAEGERTRRKADDNGTMMQDIRCEGERTRRKADDNGDADSERMEVPPLSFALRRLRSPSASP